MMTPDERKAWAHENLDRWLREQEQGQFFDAVDELAMAIEDLEACPTHKKHDCCDEYLKGSKYQRSLRDLSETIDATATAFLRQAS